jgi:hypothetical protein
MQTAVQMNIMLSDIMLSDECKNNFVHIYIVA